MYYITVVSAIVYGPRILQGVLAAVCDLYVYSLAALLFSENKNNTIKNNTTSNSNITSSRRRSNRSEDIIGLRSVADHVLFFQLTSWFNFYCLVRTYSNSMEAALVPVFLYYYFLYQKEKKKEKENGVVCFFFLFCYVP